MSWSPQLTTEPSSFKAAKAPVVPDTCVTPLRSCAATALESPPMSGRPHAITEPSSLKAANAPLVAKTRTARRGPSVGGSSPPYEQWPQVTTVPSALSAAKARSVENTSTTPLFSSPAASSGWPPQASSPQTTTEPQYLTAAKALQLLKTRWMSLPSCPCTVLASPPDARSPHTTRDPSVRSAAKAARVAWMLMTPETKAVILDPSCSPACEGFKESSSSSAPSCSKRTGHQPSARAASNRSASTRLSGSMHTVVRTSPDRSVTTTDILS
mmetsp:Transcript_44647/g.123743  ORF Transcript_44647/g.123743 Transcript_44647/m.123743 type:complete len:270 (-) Transcript_44647:168-977(-)